MEDFLQKCKVAVPKRSSSARLPQKFDIDKIKTKQVCETSSIFEVDNIKNEAIQEDFLKNGN